MGEPVGCLQGSVTHCLALPRFLEFILLFSFSGTLLVVLISGIVYACSLWLLLWFGWGGVMVPVGAIGSFRPGGQTFWAVVEPRGCVQSCVLLSEPHFPRFILLVSFSDPLHVVLVLVYEFRHSL